MTIQKSICKFGSHAPQSNRTNWQNELRILLAALKFVKNKKKGNFSDEFCSIFTCRMLFDIEDLIPQLQIFELYEISHTSHTDNHNRLLPAIKMFIQFEIWSGRLILIRYKSLDEFMAFHIFDWGCNTPFTYVTLQTFVATNCRRVWFRV